MEFCIARIRRRRIRASYLLRRLLPSIPSFRNRFRIEAIIILEHFWRAMFYKTTAAAAVHDIHDAKR